MSSDELPRPLRLACTTDHLWKLLRGIERDWYTKGEPVHLFVPETPQGAEGLPYDDIIAVFQGPEFDALRGTKLHGGIRAKLQPYSITLMTLVVMPGSGPRIKPYWPRIVEALDEFVIVETSEPSTRAPRVKTRRGRSPASKEDKRRVVEGWYEAEACGTSQEAYCLDMSISIKTLWRWRREMEEGGSVEL